jgi:hypothetical protein
VARGADTEARNVLGLTPVDAAVDQGRTEIMFYLLSVRGASRGGAAAAGGRAPRRRPPSRRDARRDAEPPRPAPAEAPAAGPQVRAFGPGTAGAPNPPSASWCFDAGRSAGAAPPAGTAPRRAETATARAATGRG